QSGGQGGSQATERSDVFVSPQANSPSLQGGGREVGQNTFPPLPAFIPPNIPTEPFALAADHSMLDLFREELRGHLVSITKSLSALATDPTAGEPVTESLKQIRGAAKLVKCEPVATLAGALSAFLRAARDGKCELSPLALDWTRYAVATIAGALATDDTFPAW